MSSFICCSVLFFGAKSEKTSKILSWSFILSTSKPVSLWTLFVLFLAVSLIFFCLSANSSFINFLYISTKPSKVFGSFLGSINSAYPCLAFAFSDEFCFLNSSIIATK